MAQVCMPRVTVVTPSYNQGAYIEATIQSVLQQDYPHVDYWVVDGGSTDGTRDILQRYDQQLHWVSEPDHGQADAVNKGFQQAQGEILGWVNSDDTYLPGAIAKAVAYFQAHPEVDMIYGEGYHVDTHGQTLSRYPTEPFVADRLSQCCFICQPTVFLRTRTYRAVGPLNIQLSYGLDYDYWIRVAKDHRIDYLDAALATSRLHFDTKTLAGQDAAHAEALRIVKFHYGTVPSTWIYAAACAALRARYMPNFYGLHHDGWAAPHLRFGVRGGADNRSYTALVLKGLAPESVRPLPLRITVGGELVLETVIQERAFTVQVALPSNKLRPQNGPGIDIGISTEASVCPASEGRGREPRRLSYCVKKIAVIDTQQREHVVYTGMRTLLFLSMLPLIFIWKFFRINGTLPYRDLGGKLLQLGSSLQMRAR